MYLHYIRAQKKADALYGNRDWINFVAEVSGDHNLGERVDQKDVNIFCQMYGSQSVCSQDLRSSSGAQTRSSSSINSRRYCIVIHRTTGTNWSNLRIIPDILK